MLIGRWLSPTSRSVLLALILVSFPAILAIDTFFTAWRVPILLMYAIPVLGSAAFFGTRVAAGIMLVAIGFGILDVWLAGLGFQTGLLSILALAAIGLLGMAWAAGQRKAAALAEERARLLELERRRGKELEDAHARLLEFFAMVAHDLRNPLTTIGGYSQMLSCWDTLAPQQRASTLSGIRSAFRQMVRLADDLQDASRIGTSRFEVTRNCGDLLAILKETVEQQRAAAPDHRLVLEGHAEQLTGRYDRDRIVQAIGNLINNAVKYSPAGGEVRVTVERIGDRAKVIVSDQGVGIAPEDIGRLFQPYERLRSTSGIKGLGLGLYIVKGIVEAHGGTVSARSEQGKGSQFIVELPLEDSSECLAAAVAKEHDH